MGRHIGSLGRKREPLDITFDYFGTTVRVHPYATDAVEIEFLEAGKDLDIEDLVGLDIAKFEAMDDATQMEALRNLTRAQSEGYKALMRSLRRLIHPDDFDAYWKVGNDHGQQVIDRMTDIRSVTEAVIAETTDFPTGRRSASETGPSETPPSSEVVSYSLVATDFDKAMALERGRPDIQEFFVMEKEAREAAALKEQTQEAADLVKLRAAGLA
jgi:hypothetical protein